MRIELLGEGCEDLPFQRVHYRLDGEGVLRADEVDFGRVPRDVRPLAYIVWTDSNRVFARGRVEHVRVKRGNALTLVGPDIRVHHVEVLASTA